MNEIALVTASFGTLDEPKPLPPHPAVDAFFFTDAQTARDMPAPVRESWTQVIVPAYPRHDFHPRLRSRYFKHQIHRLDEVRAHRWLVWADSSLRFHDLGFLLRQAERLRALPDRSRVLVVPHPDRATVHDEYAYIHREIAAGNEYLRERYAAEKMTEQLDDYVARGWNLGARLWAGGFWMIENSDALQRCWDDWWDQNLRFGLMDQLSLPVMLAAHHCQPQMLDVLLWHNDHFSYVAHTGLYPSSRR